jgi:TolA-binding protein
MTDQQHTPQHEELQDKQKLQQYEVQEVLQFLKRYGKLIGAGVAAAIVTVLVSRGIALHKASRLAEAEQLLMEARTPQQLEEVLKKYSSTPSAPIALLDLAKTVYHQGDSVQARTHYESFLKKYRRHEMRPVAEIGLAYCTEADGDFVKAAAEFTSFVDRHAGHFLQPVALLSIARCLEQAGQLNEARIILEDFLTENAGTPWAGTAETALRELGN